MHQPPSPRQVLETDLQDLGTTFAQRLRCCYPQLEAATRRLGVAAADREDLVQETLLEAWRSRQRFDQKRELLPWLLGLMRHLRANGVRRGERRRRLHATSSDGIEKAIAGGAGPRHDAESHELWSRMRSEIAALPGSYSEVAGLHLLEAMSPREMADTLAHPRATIRVRLHRALHLLRMRIAHALGLGSLWALLSGEAKAQGRRAAAAPVLIASGLVVCVAWLCVHGTEYAEASVVTSGAPDQTSVTPRTAEESRSARASSTTPAAPSTSRRIGIQVVDVEGRGVPGVGLRRVPLSGRDTLLHDHLAVTDAAGFAEFRATPNQATEIVSDRGVFEQLPGDRDACRLVVPDGISVRGSVRDEFDIPVVGAEVWLSESRDGEDRGQVVCTTDAAGAFLLSHVPQGHRIAARARGHGRSWPVEVGAEIAERGVVLRTPRGGGCVRGIACDAAGAPIANALVVVGESEQTSGLQMLNELVVPRPPAYWVRTDATGTFATSGLEPGAHPFVARAPGYAPASGTLQVADGEVVVPTVRLERGAGFRGTVRTEDGTPIALAKVEHDAPRVFEQAGLRTALDGAFEFECVEHEVTRFQVCADGYEPTEVPITPAHRQGASIEVRLVRMPRLRGTIVDGDGKPLPDVEVAAIADVRSKRRIEHPIAKSGPDGSFELARSAQAESGLAIRGPGEHMWQATTSMVTTLPDESVCIVRSEPRTPSATLSGTARTAGGSPLVAAKVFWRPAGEKGRVHVATTDAGGAFSSAKLPESKGQLFFESSRRDQPSFEGGTWTLLRGSETKAHVTAPATGRAHVRIARQDGAPLHAVDVAIFGADHVRRFAHWTGTGGTQELAPGEYVLRVMGNDFRSHFDDHFHVRAGETTDLNVVLEPAVRVKIVVRGTSLQELAPATSGEVDLTDERGEVLASIRVPLPSTLAWHLVWATQGRVDAVLRTDDGRRARTSFEIADLAPRVDPVVLRFDTPVQR